MPTPIWQPGTIYAPGSLVQPASAPPSQPDQVTNGGFESGNTGWTLAAGFSIGQFGNGTHFQGTWSLQWDLTGEARAINNNATEVVPGQVINANCQVQQGASSSGDAGARVEVLWYDASDDFISASPGNLIDSGSNQTWKQSSVAAVAPANAAFARFSVSAFRTGGGDELWIDNCSWDAIVNGLPDGLVFRAVQAIAGFSGSSEPVWPLSVGLQVVDNEVTWEAVFASRVTWEASPILVSGSYEPVFPEAPNATVADGTILWTAMDWRVTQAPQSKVVAIGASKIFAADEDIIPFSATVNPLDWTTPEDAGYIPFGFNTFGATPVTALGLYRSNLVAFNSEAYQMWQIDEDPANMAILDASPIACLFPKSVQPVSNDLVMCTPEGVRNIGIAGASTNLQAGYFGAQMDPLVLAKIRQGLIPFALFWPSMGQYWLIFGAEAFVLTMNGGAKDQSWSRYVFPEELTYWAILDGDLYLRAGSLVWIVDPEALLDDETEVSDSTLCDGDNWVDGACQHPPLAYNLATTDWTFDSTLSAQETRIIAFNPPDMPSQTYLWEITETGDPGTEFFLWWRHGGDPITYIPLIGSSGSEVIPSPSSGDMTWGVTTTEGDIGIASGSVNISCPGITVGTPFEGYLAWPYLDFGILGVDKELEGFDVVATGEFSVSFGYSQRDFSLATPGYTIDGDTLTGDMIPMPLTAPSFQIRFTFSADQAWEWFATTMYIL